MTKNIFLKNKHRTTKKERVLWIAIIILSALLFSSIWYILKSSNASMTASSNPAQRTAVSESDKARMQAFVNDIEQRRYRYPVIDVKEDRVYIPEVRMYLPLNESSRDIRYQARGETLWLSTAMAVGRQTGDADASCDRVVLLTQSANDGQNYIAEGSIKTNDGSLRYIFRHPACQIYGEAISKSLADVVKEAHYY
jgi:hypothetical protein